MKKICVVHLVRKANGIKPFERFVRAYAQYPAGVDHDLVIAFKGFPKGDIPTEYLGVAGEMRFRSFFVGDWGFDLRPYGLVARAMENPSFCFLNSFSEPLVAGWLAKLDTTLQQSGVGLVGATGSWESMYSNLFIGNQLGQQMSLLERIWFPVRVRLCKALFEPFPNYHIRTNAILLARDIISRCWPSLVIAKRSAYLFENGKRSLTRRVLQMGLQVFVIGKDGRAYSKEEWHQSGTYRAGNQENLLVADNQTRLFQTANAKVRQRLVTAAWGNFVPAG